MRSGSATRWRHPHHFDQHLRRRGETRTLIVITLTGFMMVLEIAAGIAFGSMALLADGLHMASHAAALSITAFAYIYARRHAHDPAYSFGTGKVNALSGFASAIVLVIFAVFMAWESVERLISPVDIAFTQAIVVAFSGLVVNVASVLILGGDEGGNVRRHEKRAADQNLRAAYLHVVADALTSVLAVVALLAARYLGALWVDPVMGLVGAVLVTRWSLELLRSTSAILLDKQGPRELRAQVVERIEERGDCKVADLHLWTVAPGLYALIVSVITSRPRTRGEVAHSLAGLESLAHVTVELERATGGSEPFGTAETGAQ